MNPALARILLRYGAGMLAAVGVLSDDVAATLAVDPDVLGIVSTILGLAMAAASEGWYALAKRFGWKT